MAYATSSSGIPVRGDGVASLRAAIHYLETAPGEVELLGLMTRPGQFPVHGFMTLQVLRRHGGFYCLSEFERIQFKS